MACILTLWLYFSNIPENQEAGTQVLLANI